MYLYYMYLILYIYIYMYHYVYIYIIEINSYGKSESNTRWPVSKGWLAGNFSVTGRGCLTGHTCIYRIILLYEYNINIELYYYINII